MGGAMTIPYQEFKQAGADIGAGLTEAFLNKFATAHFKAAPSIYKGSQDFNDFDVKVTATYAVKNALVFDLAPFSKARFSKVWLAHLKARGSSIRGVTGLSSVPPNVRVTTKKMEFSVTVFKKDGSIDFSIPFVWDLQALCAVILVDAGGQQKAIRLTPIKVEFSQPTPTIVAAIRDQIRKTRKIVAVESREGTGPGDTEWCIKLERLFLFIINNILSKQLASFLAELGLPRAIELVRGVSIQPFMVEVSNDALLVGGRVIASKALDEQLAAQLDAVMVEFHRRYEAEFLTAEFNPSKFKIDNTETFKWLKTKVDEAEAEARKHRRRSRARLKVPDNLFLLSNDQLFDQLAKKLLNYYRGEEFATPEFAGFRAVAGYWVKIDGAAANVIPNGIDVRANFNAHGHAGIQVRNFWDPKHWGQWEDLIDLCIDIKADPRFEIGAIPIFNPDGIYLNLILKKPDQIDLSFCGNVPGVIARALLTFIFDVMSRLVMSMLKILIALFVVKITDYPAEFPGTALKWKPNMNQLAFNSGPYLTFSGDPQF